MEKGGFLADFQAIKGQPHDADIHHGIGLSFHTRNVILCYILP